MKFVRLLSLFLLCHCALFAAAQPTTKPNKRWVVNSPLYAESSAESVILDKIVRTDKYTVIYMSYVNNALSTGAIEACNTFYIQANGKKVATFVRADNIPTRNLRNVPFTCAKAPFARPVRPFETVRFRLYFTPIPADLTLVDVIEYDGEKSCEFDIWGLRLDKKIALPPKSETPPTKPKVTKPTNTPPAVAATPKAKKKSKPSPTAKPSEPMRELVTKETVNVQNEEITVEIWDNDKEDGDIVSLMFNNAWILRHYEVKKAKKVLTLQLQKGENTLVSYAENLGLAPPNTAAVRIIDGEVSQTIIVKSDMSKSEAIRIIR
jgi:hypothetical protein